MLVMKVTRRWLRDIISDRVAQMVVVLVGMKPYWEREEDSKREAKEVMGWESEFTRRRVMTSFGLRESQLAMEERKVSRGPASRRSQRVWQSLRVLSWRWT